jgi:uncharacterized delta-60 repeat protein
MAGLDLTFDFDGRAITDLGSSFDQVSQLEYLTNGKILAVGSNGSNIVIVRYNTNGSLDNTFGVSGKLVTPLTSSAQILVAADGKITIAGTVNNQSYIFRILANGQQLDSSFGISGAYSTGNSSPVNFILLRKNPVTNSDEIIFNQTIAGISYNGLLNINGQIQPFPINGITNAAPLGVNLTVLNGIIASPTINTGDINIQIVINILGQPLIDRLRAQFIATPYSLTSVTTAALSDGSILMNFTGSASSLPSGYMSFLSHYNTNGQFDANFASNGLGRLPFPDNYAGVSDGKFDTAGRLCLGVYNPTTFELSVYRYTSNGQLDSTFGIGGKSILPNNNQTIQGLDLELDSQNRILVSTKRSGENLLNVFRISSNGAIDSSFGSNGNLQLDYTNSFIYPGIVQLGADDRLFVGSTINGDIVVSKYDITGGSSTKAVRNDFGNDQKSDILWRNTDGTVALWQMNGINISSATVIATIDSTWKIAGTGDFNADNKSDIFWQNDNGALAIWQMNGAVINIGTVLSNTITTDWKVSAIADFGGDGKSDILWRNDTGAVALWKMDGANILAASIVANIDNTWKIAGSGDFNGDGKADILWRNDNGQIATWLMDGATITAGGIISSATADWKIKGIDDFDGDGKADILWRNDNGQVALWQINGTALASAATVSSVSIDWKIAGSGDFNGDRKADILWRNDNGTNAIWFMNGAALSSASLIASADSSWKVAAPII